MNKIEEFVNINNLLDCYQNLLTDKQKNVMQKYYKFDLSLMEISNELNISRSAVLDTIEKAKNKLMIYEEKLGFYKKSLQISNILKENNVKEKIIEEIEEVLENGI